MAQVEIYTTKLCGFCSAAKRLLASKNVDYTEFDVSGDADGRAAMMDRAGGKRTVPQIFIDGQHIGGCDELYALDGAGDLDPMLAR